MGPIVMKIQIKKRGKVMEFPGGLLSEIHRGSEWLAKASKTLTTTVGICSPFYAFNLKGAKARKILPYFTQVIESNILGAYVFLVVNGDV